MAIVDLPINSVVISLKMAIYSTICELVQWFHFNPKIQLSIPLHGAQKQILDVPSGNLLHSYIEAMAQSK